MTARHDVQYFPRVCRIPLTSGTSFISSQEGRSCSATHGAHAAVHAPSGRGGAQRHRGARLHKTHGSVRDFLGQQRGL